MYARAVVPRIKLSVAEVSQVSAGISSNSVSAVISKIPTRQCQFFTGFLQSSKR